MRFIKVSLIIIIFLSLALSGSPKDGRDFPIIEIGLRVAEKGTNYCKLEWKVTNHSDITATFLDGNIEKYEVKNTNTKRKYTSDEGGKNIVLNKGDEHLKSIALEDLDKGNYQCTFTADCEEGTSGTMRISFEID